MTRIPIGPQHIRCADGRWLSILTPPRRWERHADEDDYTQEPPVRLRAVPEDPAVEASGLSRYWHSHNRREGIDAEYARVPVGIVRAFIRLHGGIDEIGPDALAELKRAAALEQPPAVETPATDSRPSIADLVAAGTHDFLGRPLTAAQLALDCLTPAVIEARRGLSKVEGPSCSGSAMRRRAPASPRWNAVPRSRSCLAVGSASWITRATRRTRCAARRSPCGSGWRRRGRRRWPRSLAWLERSQASPHNEDVRRPCRSSDPMGDHT